ncbi:MAG: EF-P beta-lysylation protein EpmB [Planctomycetaceae bacterium]|nr:EF-P beta-lysylation protein EpmB [Planctomycetaceae bacterium]
MRLAPPAIRPESVEFAWRKSLASAIRDPDQLVDRLQLPDVCRDEARRAARLFPVVVPESYLARMEPRNPADPLLRQVLPLGLELDTPDGFSQDAVGDSAAARAPGLLHKYAGRALLIAARECAVHCRYCFRRHFPYEQAPVDAADWSSALAVLRDDTTLHEIILSGGDPLVLSDRRFDQLVEQLSGIEHLRRLRIHSRLPIVLPDRINAALLDRLRSSRLTPVMVVHANHPREIVGDCADALRTLVRAGITTLNQSVLLRGVNDDVEVLAELSERLIDLGVVPYYLHQLDRVVGAAHFEVDERRGRELVAALRSRLPGYGVPAYVRELPGESGKVPLA